MNKSLFELESTPPKRERPSPQPAELDLVLMAQLTVAWAGEGGEEPRLKWWRSDLLSEFGGEDLFRRLLPHTWEWAVLQAAREAARRKDAELRAKDHDPDQIVSLFSLGFELDERVEERLQDLKRSGLSPHEALPGLKEGLRASFDRGAFFEWVKSHGTPDTTSAPAGRRLKGAPPTALDSTVRQLVAALAPPSEAYPLPHFRRGA
jgi:hypothetical protein